MVVDGSDGQSWWVVVEGGGGWWWWIEASAEFM